jgi:hypothetical protein
MAGHKGGSRNGLGGDDTVTLRCIANMDVVTLGLSRIRNPTSKPITPCTPTRLLRHAAGFAVWLRGSRPDPEAKVCSPLNHHAGPIAIELVAASPVARVRNNALMFGPQPMDMHRYRRQRVWDLLVVGSRGATGWVRVHRSRRQNQSLLHQSQSIADMPAEC